MIVNLNGKLIDKSPSEAIIDVNGVGYLCYISKMAGLKRFIYADSCSVYGFTKDQLYDELGPTTCQYPYGVSKLQGEFGAMQLKDNNFSSNMASDILSQILSGWPSVTDSDVNK